MPARVRELTEAQRAAEARLSRLEATVAQLREAQRRTGAQVAERARTMRRFEERASRLEQQVDRMEDKMARAGGRTSELICQQKAATCLGAEVAVKARGVVMFGRWLADGNRQLGDEARAAWPIAG